ncbi:hypothetical protein BJF83_04500 [Nocardiopsis sp. CNR-923]|uniref:hypothetical protein n=1 Tax=Nocardiopsis sp. CNR-923 TaxID=1904965 RepID=UPI000959029A|nr:hypothetical protein [Nocardiopsis sp. CNR-923]OLT26116.1 hypothetical protein BJF83_04500 [Nocardiopsis sp. CNR-923]
MPATSRAGRAARVASAACALAPSLLGLPLLVGAFLTTLWLFGAVPAHADGLGLHNARPLTDAAPLTEVVRVTHPVASTLGTVHQGLEERAERASGRGVDLPEPAQAVSEVSAGARRVVEEIRPERHDAPSADLLPALADPADEGAARAPRAESEPVPAEEPADRPAPAPASDAAPVAATGSVPRLHSAEDAAPAAPRRADEEAPAAQRDTDRLGGHLATGSTATAGGSSPAPGVAGYLTSTAVAAPASAPVRPTDTRLHAVPVDPADDPTVSPD